MLQRIKLLPILFEASLILEIRTCSLSWEYLNRSFHSRNAPLIELKAVSQGYDEVMTTRLLSIPIIKRGTKLMEGIVKASMPDLQAAIGVNFSKWLKVNYQLDCRCRFWLTLKSYLW
jgi:hypothetical protein